MSAAFRPLRAGTLHIPDTGNTGHLFVILTNTCKDGMNLLVPVCTQRSKFDRECLLGAGDHPFIRHASYVMYAKMQLYQSSYLIAQVQANIVSDRGAIDTKIFARIAAGVSQSGFAEPRMQTYFDRQKPHK